MLLEGQRVKACNDLEKLIEQKEAALKNPLEFVKSLATTNNSEESLLKTKDIPLRQKIYVLPTINWNKYYECVDLEDLEIIKNQKYQRVQSLRQTNKIIQQQAETSDKTTRRSTREASAASKAKKSDTDEKNYNKSWSVEEQRYLEELLLEFPPEDNEAARWRRIANKLGTRTPLQVQSHCQKYFIKLAKAGLPIPGRMPNLKTYITKKGSRGGARKGNSYTRGAATNVIGIGSGRARSSNQLGNQKTGNRIVGRGVSLNEISSMWTSFNPPITMNDEQNDNDYEDFENGYDDENDLESNEYEDQDDEEVEDADEDDSQTSSSQQY